MIAGMVASASEEVDKEKKTKYKDDGVDLKAEGGPVKVRSCTDPFWIPVLIAAQACWIVVSIMGIADGNPQKLYQPRDFQGAYCGIEENWNKGPNTLKAKKASYSMNLTSVVDEIMKQTVCSSAVRKILTDGDTSLSIVPLLSTEAARQEYLCDCCLVPCGKCSGQVSHGGDLPNSAALTSTIASRMGELTGNLPTEQLFNPSISANGATFSSNDFWGEATKYFNKVCLENCSTNFETMNSSLVPRSYTYSPAMDDPLHKEWELLTGASSNALTAPVLQLLSSAFTFEALPKEVCPYTEQYCVPMPGVEFSAVSAGSDYCTFEMAADVINAVGSAAASAFTGLGGDAIVSSATQSFGDMAGDFEKTIDSFAIVCFVSFVVGIIFLVLLRFFIGVCVWVAVGVTVFSFWMGGVFFFIRSNQCQGTSFFDTSHQAAVAVAVAAKTRASNLVKGEEAISEAMDPAGDGTDYRGVQSHTRFGKSCQPWATQSLIPSYNPVEYNSSGLVQNFCRNPYDADDLNRAKSIWCITNDPQEKWEECTAIGVIQPVCLKGYSIKAEAMRDAMWYSAFVIWALGGVWVIIILCMKKRIALAIALNKVAARFVAHNPTVVLIPVAQALISIMWVGGWCFTAAFLLSQVPADYTPTGYFETYQEASGTTSSCAFWEFGDHCGALPGACNDKWPVGEVWKDDNCQVENGTIACYRCFPPRYIFDWRFAVSFFVFLWNNAFAIALGQILIAVATCEWFFRKKGDKTIRMIVPRAVYTVFRYHLGSVAFGSFIVAVVQFIRYFMKYLEKQAQVQNNRVMVLVLKVLQCCIWCFEKCIQFLNKNAYIQIALTSKGFCTCAKKAFFLIFRNALRFATVAALSYGIHVIGYMCIISGTMTVGYYVVREMHEDISPTMPLATYFMISYLVAKLYMNVFGLAVDASLQCYLACEENNITEEFVPQDLKNFIDKHVKGKDDKDVKSKEVKGKDDKDVKSKEDVPAEEAKGEPN